MAEEWSHARISIIPLPTIPLPTIPLPNDYPAEEEGLAQSRQGAKEEENELREPTLCVFAPLREILLMPARIDLQADALVSIGVYSRFFGPCGRAGWRMGRFDIIPLPIIPLPYNLLRSG